MTLTRDMIGSDPLAVLRRWFDEAVETLGFEQASAMALATADADGHPDVRYVLCKHLDDDRGAVHFYSNTESTKANQLAEQSHAALVFWWSELSHQVRIRGTVTPIDRDEAAAYFATRDRGSQIGAWASQQSRPVASRADLDAAVERAGDEHGDTVAMPSWWGGYSLTIEHLELWHGRPNRLHDRFVCDRNDDGSWSISRMQP